MPIFPFKPRPITPEEQRKRQLELEKAKIEKEIKREIWIEKYREKIIWYAKISGIIIVILLVILLGGCLVKKIFFPPPLPPPPPPPEGPPESFKIEVKEIKIIPVETNVYDVLAKIKVSDPFWGVPEFDYKIILKDEAQNIVGERRGKEGYVLPGQEKYLLEINLGSTAPATSAELEISPQKVQKLKQFAELELKIQNVRYLHEFEPKPRTRVFGTLVNFSALSFARVDLIIVVLNRAGQPMATNSTYITDLQSETARDFRVSWEKSIEDIDRIIVEPYLNVFKSATFIKEYGASEPLKF